MVNLKFDANESYPRLITIRAEGDEFLVIYINGKGHQIESFYTYANKNQEFIEHEE